MAEIPKFSDLSGKETLEELIERVGVIQKYLNWFGAGRISSINIREIGGYSVSQTELKSKDGDVGMSSANDAPDPIRLWAGSADKDSAPWRVYKSGKGVTTGWRIQSSNGAYPYVVMDPDVDLFGAYKSNTDYILMTAQETINSPELQFHAFETEGRIFAVNVLGVKSLVVATVAGKGNLQLSGDNVLLSPTLGYVKFRNWSEVYNIDTGRTLKQDIDSLQSQINSLNLRVTALGG